MMMDLRIKTETTSFRKSYNNALSELNKIVKIDPIIMLPALNTAAKDIRNNRINAETAVPVRGGSCTFSNSNRSILIKYKSKRLDICLKFSKTGRKTIEAYIIYEKDKTLKAAPAHITNMLLSRMKNDESHYREYSLARRTLIDGTYRYTLTSGDIIREFSTTELEKTIIHEITSIEIDKSVIGLIRDYGNV